MECNRIVNSTTNLNSIPLKSSNKIKLSGLGRYKTDLIKESAKLASRETLLNRAAEKVKDHPPESRRVTGQHPDCSCPMCSMVKLSIERNLLSDVTNARNGSGHV